MNVKDGNKIVQAHDRRCAGRICYHPLLMAIVGSEEIWQCMGWDGNEEPCPGKMPIAMRYCGKCESLEIKNPTMGRFFWEAKCKIYMRDLIKKRNKSLSGAKFKKCQICLHAERLKFFKEN